MIECPACSHREYLGTLFCGECGTCLVNPPDARTRRLSPRAAAPADSGAHRAIQGTSMLSASGASLAIEVKGRGVVLPQAAKAEYSLGRAEPGQAVVPDVDLSPYGAREAGVSRVHAILRAERGALQVLDYASTNGTELNGVRLRPHVPHPVRHGDELRLGRLRLRVLWRSNRSG